MPVCMTKLVTDDYYQAMGSVEQRLELLDAPLVLPEKVSLPERKALLIFTERLKEVSLPLEARLEIVDQMRRVLNAGMCSLKRLAFKIMLNQWFIPRQLYK
jgi:hypothetical protein